MQGVWIFLASLACNLPIGYAAYRRNSLSMPGGVVSAAVLGIVLFMAHPVFWILLMTFFITSTLLTHYKQSIDQKQEAMSYAEKGGNRDQWQVLANAGIPLLLSTLILFSGIWQVDLSATPSLLIAVSFAVVNADTWATELGVLSKHEPFLITNLKQTVPRGTSGGISLRGLLASLNGSLVVATVFFIAQLLYSQLVWFHFVLVLIGGFVGSLVDSLLGASIQAQFYCKTCDKLTEKSWHAKCQSQTTFKRGYSLLRNDAVNFLSVIISCGIVLLIQSLL